MPECEAGERGGGDGYFAVACSGEVEETVGVKSEGVGVGGGICVGVEDVNADHGASGDVGPGEGARLEGETLEEDWEV